MITNTSDVSVVWVLRSALGKGMYTVPHTHNTYHLTLVTRGKMGVFSGSDKKRSNTRNNQEGMAELIKPHTVHGVANVDTSSVMLELKFMVNDDALRCALDTLPASFKVTEQAASILLVMEDAILREAASPQMINSAASFFLHYIIDTNAGADASAQREKRPSDEIVRFIDERCDGPLSLDDIARHSGFSRNYASSLFSKEYGMTISEYITQARIKKACQLLAYTDTPIAQVYPLCGFNDQHNFGRSFKKLIGMPPVEYRRTHDKGWLCYDDESLNSFESAGEQLFTYIVDANRLIQWSDIRTHTEQDPEKGMITEGVRT